MTTILSVRHRGKVAIGGDGQVTLNNAAIKHEARKIRSLAKGSVLVGFAGAAADGLALLDRFEVELAKYPANMLKAAAELAKQWRTDKVLRKLEAIMLAVSHDRSLLVSGTGDLMEPDDGIMGVGSGGNLAVAAARALKKHSELSAAEIVTEALAIAGDIDVFTNAQVKVEVLEAGS